MAIVKYLRGKHWCLFDSLLHLHLWLRLLMCLFSVWALTMNFSCISWMPFFGERLALVKKLKLKFEIHSCSNCKHILRTGCLVYFPVWSIVFNHLIVILIGCHLLPIVHLINWKEPLIYFFFLKCFNVAKMIKRLNWLWGCTVFFPWWALTKTLSILHPNCFTNGEWFL